MSRTRARYRRGHRGRLVPGDRGHLDAGVRQGLFGTAGIRLGAPTGRTGRTGKSPPRTCGRSRKRAETVPSRRGGRFMTLRDCAKRACGPLARAADSIGAMAAPRRVDCRKRRKAGRPGHASFQSVRTGARDGRVAGNGPAPRHIPAGRPLPPAVARAGKGSPGRARHAGFVPPPPGRPKFPGARRRGFRLFFVISRETENEAT